MEDFINDTKNEFSKMMLEMHFIKYFAWIYSFSQLYFNLIIYDTYNLFIIEFKNYFRHRSDKSKSDIA